MPRASGAPKVHPPNHQLQFLESKVNKLRWANNDLNKQVFDAVQRGHRLAAKLGYQDLDEAERALATQPGQGSESQQSQLEQLGQYPSEELALHVQALQAELVSHIQLSQSTLEVLGDAMEEITRLKEENNVMKEELDNVKANMRNTTEEAGGAHSNDAEKDHLLREMSVLRIQYAQLKRQYENLQQVKKAADDKHMQDFRQYKEFCKYVYVERDRERSHRPSKRRKVRVKGGEKGSGQMGKDEEQGDFWDNVCGQMPLLPVTPTRTGSPGESAVLAAKNLNSPTSSTLPSSHVPTPLKTGEGDVGSQTAIKRRVTECVTKGEEAEVNFNSSQTEPDSQPITFLYPSQLNFSDAPPSTVPQKRSRSPGPGPKQDSSDTELESQAPAYLLPSQITPKPLAQSSEMTPKPQAVTRQSAQLPTPVSLARPQQPTKGTIQGGALPVGVQAPPSSPTRSEAFRRPRTPFGARGRHPETPLSFVSRKGKEKERAGENDENTPAVALVGASAVGSSSGKKYPADYSIYKGRGRYGAELQAGKDTINAEFEIDPEQNAGVGFQFDEVVRDKEKRKNMHAADCECCREYYRRVGALPDRLQRPKWRSPPPSPTNQPDSFNEENAAIEQHKQEISRHREQWPRPATPPGYWNIGFPDTQEVAEMNAEARRMHARKRAVVASDAKRGGKYRKR